jgi:hypothetical protein
MGKALEAVGESYFFGAEALRAGFDRESPPTYAGRGDTASVTRFLQGKMQRWFTQAYREASQVDAKYAKIAKLSPAPPPGWTVRGMQRAGSLWADLITQARTAPLPDEMQRDAALRGAYLASLETFLEPLKKRAKQAMASCLELSIARKEINAFSWSCYAWLNANYKSEYYFLQELFMPPARTTPLASEAPPSVFPGAP